MAYVVLESSVRTHRKMLAAGPAACWLWVCGLGHCQEGLTDGHIADAAIDFLGVRDARDLAVTLVRVRLWDVAEDGWIVHDYHEHNKPADEVRRIMRARAEGGKLGGRPKKTLEDNLQGSEVSRKPRNLPRNPSGTSGMSGTSVPTVTTDRNGTAPPAAAPPTSPAVLTFDVIGSGQKSWTLTTAHLADLSSDYEHLNVLAECRKAYAWVKAKPSRRKTAKGMPAFLVNWLNRAADQGGGTRAAALHLNGAKPLCSPAEIRQIARAAGPHSWAAECIREHDGRCGGPVAHREQMESAVPA